MRLVIVKDYVHVSDWGARYIKKRINDFNPGPDRPFVLGLPTGLYQIVQNETHYRAFRFSRQYTNRNI